MPELQISLPPLDPSASPKTLISAAEAEALVESLPMADPLALGRTLLPALQLQNRHPRRLPERFEMLFAQMPPVLRMLEDLKRSARTFDLAVSNRKTREIHDLAEELVREMGFGFKRLVAETILAHSKPVSRYPERDARAIYWALQCIALELMLGYSDYRPESAVAWRECIELYVMARRLGLSKTLVEDPLEAHLDEMHLGVVFRRILLLAILDPYRMRRGEVWAAYDCLGAWAGRVKVGGFTIPTYASGHFIIDIRGNRKPEAYNPERIPDDAAKYLMLNVTPLNAVVHEYTKALSDEERRLPPCLRNLPRREARQLLQQMLVAWHIVPTRRHPRAEKAEWFVSTCGVTAVHQQLKNALGIEWKIAGEQEEFEDDYEDDYGEETIVEIDGAMGGAATLADHHSFRCRQFNISATGMGLVLSSDEFPHINVGQLILLQQEEPRSKGRQKIGVIKRLLRREDENVEVGVRLITGASSPALIEVTTDMDETMRHPALLVEPDNKHPQLLTPHFVYRPQRHFYLLQCDDSPILAHAGRLLESTCCYDRFEFTMDEAGS